MPLKPGDRLPAIVCQTQSGSLDLDAYRASKTLVIWTYPKDATAG